MSARRAHSRGTTEHTAEQAEDQRLGHDQARQRAARHTQRAQTREQRLSLHDQESHGVVNHETADQQRQQTQGVEVGVEGVGEIARTARLAAGVDDLYLCGQGRGERGQCRGGVAVVAGIEFDARHAPLFVQIFLGAGDVEQGHVIGKRRA